MSNKNQENNDDGWLGKVRRVGHNVLYRPANDGANSGDVTEEQVLDQMPTTPVAKQTVQVPIDSSKTEQFVAKFREAVERNGGNGAKFIQLLYKEANKPEPQHYQKVLSFMQVMDPSVSAQSLLNSIEACERMITTDTDRYLKQGEDKKQDLEKARASEKANLELQVNEINSSIATLQEQLNAKKAELAARLADQEKLDGKYAPLLEEVTRTIAAVSSASQTVLGGLSTAKEGITNNLK